MPIVPSADQCHDFGYWRDESGRSGLVTWNRRTGQLTYIGPAGLELLAVIVDEDDVRATLDGWQAHLNDGINWIRQRVTECPTCHGEGWVQPNYDTDGPVDVTCWCQILGNDPQ